MSTYYRSNIISRETAFVFTVDTSNSGVSLSDQFQLPFVDTYTYNCLVEWGDGNSDSITSWNQSETLHTYSSSGIYTIKINGTFGIFSFNDGGDKLKLLTIDNWGGNAWTSFNSAFYGCANMTGNFSDSPDLSAAIDIQSMFRNCVLFDSNINNWDVSSIQNFSNVFRGASIFNQPLNDWDVSSSITMLGAFADALLYNQPLNDWDVSGVTTFSSTFSNAEAFNQPLNDWDVSAGVVFSDMFINASSFDQPLNLWNMSLATNLSGMFASESVFNQNIQDWDVSSVTSFFGMFNANKFFNQPLNNWDVSSATNMALMFRNCVFNQPLNNWNVASVTSMSTMFAFTSVFDQNIGDWDVSSVTDMSVMFGSAGLSTANYNALLIGWTGWVGGVPTKTVQSSVLFDGGSSAFSLGTDAEDARDYLINTKLWTITDGGGV